MIVSISDNFLAGDLLSCGSGVSSSVVCSYNTITGILNITGAASAATYQAAGRLVYFQASNTYLNTDSNTRHWKKLKLECKDVTGGVQSAPVFRQIQLSTAMTVFTDGMRCQDCYAGY